MPGYQGNFCVQSEHVGVTVQYWVRDWQETKQMKICYGLLLGEVKTDEQERRQYVVVVM